VVPYKPFGQGFPGKAKLEKVEVGVGSPPSHPGPKRGSLAYRLAHRDTAGWAE